MPLSNRGSKLLETNDLKGARANFDAAIREDPDIWPAYLDRAIVSAREGKWQAALQDCDVVVRHRPGFFRTFVVRATIYQNLGRDRQSLADLDKVCRLNYWQKARYIDILATACGANGDFGSAVRYEQQAIASGKLAPDELGRAQRSLANCQHREPRG
jgi:Tfp pilus assembly protein PilF